MSNIFYNYIYLDPRKPGQYSYEGLNFSLLFEPFYVGRGIKNRLYNHLQPSSLSKNSHNSIKINKINSILKEGYNLKEYVFKLDNNLTLKHSKEIEIGYIWLIGRYHNNTGSLTNFRLYEDSIKDNTKIYGSPKEKHPLYGKGHTQESKNKISANHANCSGLNNGRAKHYIFINKEGVKFNISGNFNKFCIDNNIGIHSAQVYVNKGKIISYRNRSDSNKQSLLGWEIIEL